MPLGSFIALSWWVPNAEGVVAKLLVLWQRGKGVGEADGIWNCDDANDILIHCRQDPGFRGWLPAIAAEMLLRKAGSLSERQWNAGETREKQRGASRKARAGDSECVGTVCALSV